ncbi:hypothetical protein HGA91_02640 [candidate division WWE3 bacterium]|nr:hypothetical protein [candidate division WWE3 bacterium]
MRDQQLTQLLGLVSVLMVGLFIVSGYIMPVGDDLYAKLFPKPESEAAPMRSNGAYPLGDVNQDCIVDQSDITYVTETLTNTQDAKGLEVPPTRMDVNQDGIIDIFDLGIISQQIGKECEPFSLNRLHITTLAVVTNNYDG